MSGPGGHVSRASNSSNKDTKAQKGVSHGAKMVRIAERGTNDPLATSSGSRCRTLASVDNTSASYSSVSRLSSVALRARMYLEDDAEAFSQESLILR